MTHLPFRLGYLTHLDGIEDPEELYDYTLEIARLAESLGYDSLWVSERHFHAGFAGVPDALTFLAAAAAVTTRIHLGTAIVPAPLRNSVELTERAAIVDALSRGRLEFGIGLGNPGSAFTVFGADESRRRADTDAAEDRIHALLSGAPVDDRGTTLFPPRPTLRDRVWRATQDLDSTAYTAARGDGLLLPRARYAAPEEIGPWQRRVAQHYAASFRGDGPLRIGSSRTLYPAASKAVALDELAAGTLRWNSQYQQAVRSGDASRPLEQLLSDDHVGYGSADDLVEWLEADVSIPWVTDLIVGFQPAVTTFEQEAEKLAVIATAVAPRLGWTPAVRGDLAVRDAAPAGWRTDAARRNEVVRA